MQLADVTNYILYMEIRAKNQFTQLINACVSHELRNPLNSIIAKNIEKSALYQRMLGLFQQFETSFRDHPTFKECVKILEELDDGRIILDYGYGPSIWNRCDS